MRSSCLCSSPSSESSESGSALYFFFSFFFGNGLVDGGAPSSCRWLHCAASRLSRCCARASRSPPGSELGADSGRNCGAGATRLAIAGCCCIGTANSAGADSAGRCGAGRFCGAGATRLAAGSLFGYSSPLQPMLTLTSATRKHTTRARRADPRPQLRLIVIHILIIYIYLLFSFSSQ